MLLALKKGFGTSVGIASVSLISAGLLGTNMYSIDSQNHKASIESNQIMALVKTMHGRLKVETSVTDFNKGTPGSAKIFENPKGLNDGRLHFLKKSQKCNSHYTNLGLWDSSSAPAVPTLPCNVFRVYGPFKTKPTGCSNTTTCMSVIKDPANTSAPMAVISIPLRHSYIKNSYRTTIATIRKLQSDLSSNLDAKVFVYKKINNESNNAIAKNPFTTNTNFGLSSSILFPNNTKGCNTSSSPCTLIIALPAIKTGGGGGGDGGDCAFPPPTSSLKKPKSGDDLNTCLDVEGKNAIKTQISFSKDDANAQVSANETGPLLVWQASAKPEDINGNNDKVNAGLMLHKNDLILKLPDKKHFTILSDLNVNEAVTIGDSLVVGKNTTIGENLTVVKNADVGENLTVEKNAIIRDKLYLDKKKNKFTFLEVDDNEDLNISTNTNKHVIIRGDLLADKAVSIRNDISIGTNATIGKDAYINGALYMNKESKKDAYLKIGDDKDLHIVAPKHVVVRSDLLADKALSVRTDLSVGTNITAGKNIITNDKLIFGKSTDSKTNFEIVDDDLVLTLNQNKHLSIKGDIDVSGYASASNLSVKDTTTTRKLILSAGTGTPSVISTDDKNKITIAGLPLNKLLPGLALQDVLPTPIGSYIWKPNCPAGSWPAIFTMPLTVPNRTHSIRDPWRNTYNVVNLYHIYPVSISSERWRIDSKGGTYGPFPGSTPIIYSQIYCDNRDFLDESGGKI